MFLHCQVCGFSVLLPKGARQVKCRSCDSVYGLEDGESVQGTYYESVIGPQRTLQVQEYPLATLVSYSAPSRARAGASVSVSVTIRNDGGAGYCNAQLEDRGTGAVLSGVGDTLAAGASATWPFPALPTMPNRDWPLRIRYGHQEYGEQYWDGSRDFTIELSVPTGLSLTLSPTQVAPGESVSWYGTLTRTDTGAGLAGQTVVLQISPTWSQAATAITDSVGAFSGSFTAPGPGSYIYRPYYGGSASPLLYYEAATGEETGLAVSGVAAPKFPAKVIAGGTVAAIILTGLGLAAWKKR